MGAGTFVVVGASKPSQHSMKIGSRAPLPMSVWQVVSIRSICWLKETCASLPLSLSHATTADLISLWVIVLAAPQSSSFTA